MYRLPIPHERLCRRRHILARCLWWCLRKKKGCQPQLIVFDFPVAFKHCDICNAALLNILMTIPRSGGVIMRKFEIADPEVMRIAIQQEIARSDESRYDHRLHGLLLVTGGHSCQQVAELFGEDRRTVQRWVKRFESHGLEGVREGERPGRPATLDALNNGRHWGAT